jgi:DNA-binding SARP family transcriptional activator
VDSFIEKPADPSAPPRDAFEDLDDISPEFDEWLGVERSRRVATKIVALEHRAEQLLGEGRGAESVIIVNEMQALDPTNENALELGMEVEFLHGHPGQIAKRFKETADHLKADLGVNPSTSSRDLRDRLIARLTGRKAAAVPLKTDHEYFVGRAREERMAATSSANDVARQAHEAIAARYESMSEALKS